MGWTHTWITVFTGEYVCSTMVVCLEFWGEILCPPVDLVCPILDVWTWIMKVMRDSKIMRYLSTKTTAQRLETFTGKLWMLKRFAIFPSLDQYWQTLPGSWNPKQWSSLWSSKVKVTHGYKRLHMGNPMTPILSDIDLQYLPPPAYFTTRRALAIPCCNGPTP